MKDCSNIDIVAYFENSLGEDEKRKTEAHISGCAECLDIISDFQRSKRLIMENIKDVNAPDMRDIIISEASKGINLRFLRPSWALSLALHLTVFSVLALFFVSVNNNSSQDISIPVVNTVARNSRPVLGFYLNRQYDVSYLPENITAQVDHIASSQNSDGSWNGYDPIQVTSLNLLILYAFNRNNVYHDNLTSGTNYLVVHQNQNGTFSGDSLVNSMASTIIILQYIHTSDKELERCISRLYEHYNQKTITAEDPVFPFIIKTLYNEVFYQKQIMQINDVSTNLSPIQNAIVLYFTKGEINPDIDLNLDSNRLYDEFYYMFYLYNISLSEFHSIVRDMKTEKYDIQTLEGKLKVLAIGLPYLFPRM